MYKNQLITFFGNQRQIAKAIGKSPALVSLWPELVPMKWAMYFYLRYKGRVRNGVRLTLDHSLYEAA